MSQPFIVEFAGMMGAGKTTISTLVIQELNRRGYHCASKEIVSKWMAKSGFDPFFSPASCGFLERITYYSKWSFLIAAFRFPILALKAYRYAFSVAPKNMTSLQISRSSMNWMGAFKKYVRLSSYDVVVFEDAAIQSVNDVALTGDHCSKQAHQNLISALLLNKKHFVVFLKIDAETAMERIKGRSEILHRQGLLAWEYENESLPFQFQKTFQAIDVFNSTAKTIKTMSPQSLIEIDALRDLQENVNAIVTLLEKKMQAMNPASSIDLTEYSIFHPRKAHF